MVLAPRSRELDSRLQMELLNREMCPFGTDVIISPVVACVHERYGARERAARPSSLFPGGRR